MLQTTRYVLFCASALCAAIPAFAATPLVTAAIDDAATVTMANELPVAAHDVTDLGRLDDNMAVPHVMMALKRSPERQAAFDRLVADQLKPQSPSYHKWLAASDLRAYGPAQADIDKTVRWLQSHGLTINGVSPSGMSIDFGGTARQLGETFHTSLHRVATKGEMHIANMTDPAFPAALAPVVQGATLSDFFPKPAMIKRKPSFTISDPPGYFLAVGPADFATIYNVKPLYNGSQSFGTRITGAGVTIALVEQTDILPADWQTFRTNFKLTGYKQGTLTLTHPGKCGDPGFTGDEDEAALDTEWASAVAPNATIVEASCPSSGTVFGVEYALQNLVELGTTASVLSISYGGPEVSMGLTFLSLWSNLVEEGASEGLSIMVSTGDSGSSSNYGITNTGLASNGLSSNAYVTAVGGTDFYDTALNKIGTYWSLGNTSALGSAKSYIPEMAWNNSCASSVIVKYLGYKNAQTLCNSNETSFYLQQGVGGSGGQSLYYSKPDWQNIGVPGMPADGVRDQPDVSLFAANGTWAHFYVYCMSDQSEGGTPCDYTKLDDVLGNAAGGTSFAAPAFGGVMALIVEGNAKFSHVKDFKLGNPAPELYQLAMLQFNNPLLVNSCKSVLGNAISSSCVFNNVTVGNNAEPCVKGTPNCHSTAESTMGVGILTASKKAPFVDAFPATPGYSLATGLGTVNVTNLFLNFLLQDN